MSIKRVWLLLWILSALFSCRKENLTDTKFGTMKIQISYSIDSLDFTNYTARFRHPAGYPFAISKLQYYLSGIVLYRSATDSLKIENYFYLDAMIPSKNILGLTDIPSGNYTGISFFIGLDTTLNKSGKLPSIPENLNMAWPGSMGGGYHFIKLEGLYEDSTGTHGYAMHLGKDTNLIRIYLLNRKFSIGNGNNFLTLKMNIAEWFKNPELYNFNTDGNYSMSNTKAMAKLKRNAGDVFNE